MTSDENRLNLLIFVTCENATFKDRYAVSMKHWLLKVSETFEKKPVLKFTVVNVISSSIPPLEELKKYDGILISGSFSRTKENALWMRQLRHTIRLCFVHQIPIFGICFGFQILSQAFGSYCEPSPHGFNFGGIEHVLSDKALPYFRPFIEDFYSDDKSLTLFEADANHDSSHNNEHTTHNGHTNNGFITNGNSTNDKSNHVHVKSLNSLIGAFSHNDIVTSAPNVDNIDFYENPDYDRNDMYERLSELNSITVSSLDKVPVVGVLIGNRTKVFMIAVQLHPEFDTISGKKFWKDILSLKLSQGTITNQQFNDNLKQLSYSNSGYVYGKMALSLFMNGNLKPKY